MNTLSHLGFHRAEACPALADYIDSYWFINSHNPLQKNYDEFLHPDGGIGIIFNYGNKLRLDNTIITENCFFDGTNTQTRRLGLYGEINALGIRFKPAAAHAFISIPLNDLKNRNISLFDTGQNTLSNLHSILAESKNLKEKIQILNNTMLGCFQANKKAPKITTSALEKITDSKGTLPINILSEQLGISKRKLERLFNLQLGMTPLEYSKNIRIKFARSSLKQKNIDYNDISFKLNFFDQSHFIKQFKSVVGITPGQYRQRFTDRCC